MQDTLPKMVLLDVYETMLDMSEVENRVNDLMGSKKGYMFWFEFWARSFKANKTLISMT